MCLAIPAKIVKIFGNEAEADFGGIRRRINITLLDNVKEGDYVIVHAGFAIQKLRKEDAEKTLALWREVLERI
ncbi:MAG: HypC/HybG/HupF family hydrogenase formation chaperone [Candidatus Baldrarchaeia archaeon]